VERSRGDQVGLGFRPLSENKVAGIEGVLWLDRASAQPRTAEWDYRDPTRTIPQGARGLIAFGLGRDSLPQVVRWWVRVPQVFRTGHAGEVTKVIESGTFVLSGNDRPVEDPEGVFAALGEVFKIEAITVEAQRAQRSMSEELTKHIAPDELLGAPATHGWDIIKNLRPNWLRRSQSVTSTNYEGLSLVVYQDRMRLSCLAEARVLNAAQPTSTYHQDMPGLRPGGRGGPCMTPQAALASVPAADIASIEYVPPIEAGAIYGMGHGYGVVVIHSRRK
jgi:hypothetical protein